MKSRRAIICSSIIVAAAVPALGAVLCVVLLLLQAALFALRLVTSRLPGRGETARTTVENPYFSIHVATHSEPPDLVIRTLRALIDQDWPTDRYEIIVMDNNTADEALWMPVRRFCTQQGRVSFLHQMGVQGAKAGALNIALGQTDPAATHIATVDADYIVHPNFLTIAAAALHRTGADYVQFPQAYAGTADTAAGVDAELEEYFRTNAVVADEVEAVLLTGTLCVISKKTLIAAGGWSGVTTTEDAELGLRLCRAGNSGRFINQVVGEGLLPFSLTDLEKQRYRWCSGNLQTFLHHFGTFLPVSDRLTLRKRLAILTQLSAWLNLGLVPCVLLLFWVATGQAETLAAKLAALIILLSLGDVIIRVVGRGLRDRLPPHVFLGALACRIALAPQSARATFDALHGGRLEFVVTDKSGAGATNADRLHVCSLLLFAAAFLLLAIIQPAETIVVAALGALMLPLPAAFVTDRSLRAYHTAITATPKETVS